MRKYIGLLFCLISVSPLCNGAALISATGPATSPGIGSSFTVTVQGTGMADVYAFQFDLSFDPTLLTATSVSEGAFLGTGGSTRFVPGTIDNGGGHITFTADTLVGSIPGASGSGTLATITFTGKARGTSALTPANVILLNSSLNTITVTTQNGSVQIGAGAAPPSPVSLAPAVSIGSNQSLSVTYNAPAGYQTLSVVNVLINNFLDGRHACYLAYSVPSTALYLVDDAGDGGGPFAGSLALGSSGRIQNSQCSVGLTSATGSGNTLNLTLNISFTTSFGGNKVVYAAARDLAQGNSGWQTMGVVGIPPLPSAFPNPVGLSPSSGSSLTAVVTFTYQDQSTATNLQTVWALINTAIDGRAACYVAYYRPGNQLYLYPDNGDGTQATNIVLAGNNTIGNSQCTISAQGANVQTSGNTVTVTLPIAFKTAFVGFKGVWLAAQTLGGAQTSGWQALGAWAVPGQ